VQSALLVAPPDIAGPGAITESTKGFALPNPGRLPFPSVLVGSENDPYMTLEGAQDLALALGSDFFDAGCVGHINIDSGHGPWPQGEALLQELIYRSFKEIKHK
jgi:predicted alpha/beta hydrolase family esterase